MPERPRAPEYGADFKVRQVNSGGCFSWQGTMLRVTPLLRLQPIGLKPVDDDEWELYYGPLLIGVVLVRAGKPRIEPASMKSVRDDLAAVRVLAPIGPR